MGITAVEHKADDRGRWAGGQELPVLVDRADPSKFVILWDEAQPTAFPQVSWSDQDPPEPTPGRGRPSSR